MALTKQLHSFGYVLFAALLLGCATTPQPTVASPTATPTGSEHRAGFKSDVGKDRFMRIPLVAPAVPMPEKVPTNANIVRCKKAPNSGAFITIAAGKDAGVTLGARGTLRGDAKRTFVVISVEGKSSRARIDAPCKDVNGIGAVTFAR